MKSMLTDCIYSIVGYNWWLFLLMIKLRISYSFNKFPDWALKYQKIIFKNWLFNKPFVIYIYLWTVILYLCISY